MHLSLILARFTNQVAPASEKPAKRGLPMAGCEIKLRARFGETQRMSGPVAGTAREMMIYVS